MPVRKHHAVPEAASMERVSIVPIIALPENLDQALTWRFTSEHECDILSSAAWCSVKQQQREPIRKAEEVDRDGPSEVPEGTMTSLSDNNEVLVLDGTIPIKKTFLDQLAEILCFKKDPSFITATAMTDEDEAVNIVVARNGTPWRKRDVEILNYLTEIMERCSRHETLDENPLPNLRRKLLEYYTPRLRYHVRDLVKHEAGKTRLAFFSEACPDFLSNRMDVYDFAEIVEALSFSTDFYSTLSTAFSPTVRDRIANEDLAFIRRPWRAAGTFCHAAQEIDKFQKVRVQLLTSYPSKSLRSFPPRPNKRAQVSAKLQRKYDVEIKKVKWVHAEMRVMTYLLSQGIEARSFPYLGVSKKTCFLCGSMLQNMGHFQTRANHGKIYAQWTLPAFAVVTQPDFLRIEGAVQDLVVSLREEATRTIMGHLNVEKESAMAAPISQPAMGRTPFQEYILDPRRVQREAEFFQRQFLTSEGGNPNTATSNPEDVPLSTTRETAFCGQITSSKTSSKCTRCRLESAFLVPCTRCRSRQYCDNDCREGDWHTHKFHCSLGRPVDAADYLVQACQANQPPRDVDTATAFGFRYFVSAYDRLKLFGIYRCLVIQYGVCDDELREALSKDQLRDFILFRMSQLPSTESQSLLNWLTQQQGFGAGVVCDDFEKLLVAARKFLSPVDRSVSFDDLKPKEKQSALVFYGQILNGYVPDSDEDNWIYLGFCTAQDAWNTHKLRAHYAALIHRCKFDEFWEAMASSNVINLFTKYGLVQEVIRLRNFQNHMQNVTKGYQSVWELKRFTQQPLPHPMRAVQVDYCFMRCDGTQRMILRDIYRRFFETGTDEMKLHEACVDGRLAEFLRSVLGELPVAYELLDNPYPLDGCGYMGMVFKNAVLCPESLGEMTRRICRDKGRTCKILTFPDAVNGAMRQFIEERALFLRIGVRKRVTLHDGKALEELMTE